MENKKHQLFMNIMSTTTRTRIGVRGLALGLGYVLESLILIMQVRSEVFPIY